MLYYYCKNKKELLFVLLCFLSKILRKAKIAPQSAIEEMLGMNIIKKGYFIN